MGQAERGGRVLLFARAAEPGRVKSRLQPPLSARQAAALYDRMLQHAVTRLAAGGYPLDIWFDGCADHGCWSAPAMAAVCAFHPQPEGDLGERMAAAAARVLGEGASFAILTGTDCPELGAGHISAAATALLAGSDVVIAPAADGGYVLLGIRAFHPALFSDIPWGGAEVLAATLSTCERLGLSVCLLPTLADIDRPEDLGLLPPDWLPEPET